MLEKLINKLTSHSFIDVRMARESEVRHFVMPGHEDERIVIGCRHGSSIVRSTFCWVFHSDSVQDIYTAVTYVKPAESGVKELYSHYFVGVCDNEVDLKEELKEELIDRFRGSPKYNQGITVYEGAYPGLVANGDGFGQRLKAAHDVLALLDRQEDTNVAKELMLFNTFFLS